MQQCVQCLPVQQQHTHLVTAAKQHTDHIQYKGPAFQHRVGSHFSSPTTLPQQPYELCQVRYQRSGSNFLLARRFLSPLRAACGSPGSARCMYGAGSMCCNDQGVQQAADSSSSNRSSRRRCTALGAAAAASSCAAAKSDQPHINRPRARSPPLFPSLTHPGWTVTTRSAPLCATMARAWSR